MIARRLACLALLLATPLHAAIKVGQPARDFTVRLLDGTKLSLADLKGQVVVLNFWATWCGPCKRELPLLDAYYRAVKDHGVRIFAVTTEGSLPLSTLKPLFAVMTITPARSISPPYGPIDGAVPSNYIIDRKGVVRYAKAAAFDLDDLNRELIPLINETP